MSGSPPSPPPGYSVRHPRLEDAEAAAVLRRAFRAGRRDGEVTADAVLQEWRLPRLTLERDAWLVLAGRELVASAFVFEDAPGVYVRVHTLHPDHEAGGLEEHLLDLAEWRVLTRARETRAGSTTDHTVEPSPMRQVRLAVVAYESESHTIDLYAARGYRQARTFVELAASLEGTPPAPAVPAGILVRRFRRDADERPVYDALQEAFLDHWEPTVLSFEEWLTCDYHSPGVDPGLWWVAWDGDDVAGVLLASATGVTGHIDDLGVRRPWRRRGLGRALLLTALADLRRRGLVSASLGVDTLNPTGALHLYLSAEMEQAGEAHLVFEQELAVP